MKLKSMPLPKKLYSGCGPCVVAIRCKSEPHGFEDVIQGRIFAVWPVSPGTDGLMAAQAEVEAGFAELEKRFPADNVAFLEGMAAKGVFIPLTGAGQVAVAQQEASKCR